MAEAKANYSQPAMESVTLTLSAEEALLFTKFISKTKISIVEELFIYASVENQRSINNVLYKIYCALCPFYSEADRDDWR